MIIGEDTVLVKCNSKPLKQTVRVLTSGDSTLIVLLGYGVLAVLLTYPLVFHVREQLLGDGEAWLFLWNMWFVRFSLLEGRNAFGCTDYIFFPHGECTYLHSWAFLPSLFSIPLQSFLSLVTISNLVSLGTFVLASWGTYRLARFLGVRPIGAFLSGFAFGFSPYHFAHALGHLNLTNYQWLPFFFLSVLKGLRFGWNSKRVAYASFWLVLTALSDWYYFIFSILGLVLVTALWWPVAERVWWKHFLGSGTVVTVAVIVLSPLIIPMSRMATMIPAEDLAGRYSADLQSFVIPGPVSSYGAWFESLNARWSAGEAEAGSFLPWSLVLLSAWGWYHLGKRWQLRSAAWIGVFFLLSLGPSLHFGGQDLTGEVLPFAWFSQIPGYSLVRAPVRFHLMTSLGLALMYGASICRLLSVSHGPRFVMALGGLLVLESLSVPLVMSRPNVSDFYHWLRDQDNGAVIDLHSPPNAGFYQTVHHKKVLGHRWLSRVTRKAASFTGQEPLGQVLAENRPVLFINRPAEAFPDPGLMKFEDGLEYHVVALGYPTETGEMHLVSSGPVDVWYGNQLVASKTTETWLRVRDVASEPHNLIRIVSIKLARLSQRLVWLTSVSDGVTRAANIKPVLASPNLGKIGFSWIVYKNLGLRKMTPSTAIEKLGTLGFRWIVVPYYGNPHFVEGILGLRSVFQDQWVQAFELPSGRSSIQRMKPSTDIAVTPSPTD